jgi:GrpB-like predicted nucleotidyltransferase (UPF0157 family)
MIAVVERASKPKAEYYDWNPKYSGVVASLLEKLHPLPPFLTFEHVGSTAIPGCGGKGVLDLIALYDDGFLEVSKRFLIDVGFVRQGPEFAKPWPDERPMFLGYYWQSKERFLFYVHVLHHASDEVRRFRTFKSRLMENPAIVAEYCELKRMIVNSGVTDTDIYAAQKRFFMHKVLGADHALANGQYRRQS